MHVISNHIKNIVSIKKLELQKFYMKNNLKNK